MHETYAYNPVQACSEITYALVHYLRKKKKKTPIFLLMFSFYAMGTLKPNGAKAVSK